MSEDTTPPITKEVLTRILNAAHVQTPYGYAIAVFVVPTNKDGPFEAVVASQEALTEAALAGAKAMLEILEKQRSGEDRVYLPEKFQDPTPPEPKPERCPRCEVHSMVKGCCTICSFEQPEPASISGPKSPLPYLCRGCDEPNHSSDPDFCEACRKSPIVSIHQPNQRVGSCPLEQRIAKALDRAKLEYRTEYEGGVKERLDFYLPTFDVHIEVKGGHTPRISDQLSRTKNAIVAQGEKAVRLLAGLIEQTTVRTWP